MSSPLLVALLLLPFSLLVFIPSSTAEFTASRPARGIGDNELALHGSGSGPVRLLFLDWAHLFSTDHKLLNFTFERTTLTASYPLLSNGSLAFVQSWEALTKSQRKEYPNLSQFPYLVVPSTFVYNLPEVVTKPGEELVLSIEILAEIYIGEIVSWRDPKILKLNPSLRDQIPDKKITSVTFFGSSTSNLYQVRAFYRHSSKFRKVFSTTFDSWPDSIQELNPRIMLVNGTFGPSATVQNTPYSVGLTSLAAYLQASGGTLPAARLFHRGQIISLTPETGLAFLKQARISPLNDIEFPDSKTKFGLSDHLFSGWPLVGMSWLVLRDNYKKEECVYYEKVLRFFRWGLIDKQPGDVATDTGSYILPVHYRNQVVKLLEGLKCQGEPLLQYQVVDDHDSGAFPALLSINWVMASLIMVPGIIIFLLLSRDAKGSLIPSIAKLYSGILLLGALVVYVSVVFYYLVPDETWVCQLRQWLTALGLTIFLGALFTRTLQIHRIHRMARSKKVPNNRSAGAMKRRAFLDFLLGLGITVPVQIILLVLWTVISPLKAELKIINEIDRTASWTCNCSNVWLWLGLEIGFFLCLLSYGVLVVYRTWDLKTNGFTESKWLLMAIYNLLLTVAALVPLFATLEIWDDKVFIIASVGLNFAVASTLCCLYIQRGGAWIEHLIWKWRTSSTNKSGSSPSTTNPNASTTTKDNQSGLADTKSTNLGSKTMASNSMSAKGSLESPF